jgi:hypothetical protein
MREYRTGLREIQVTLKIGPYTANRAARKGPGEIPGFLSSSSNLTNQQQRQLACLHVRPRLQPVEIHSAGESRGIEADFVIACYLFPLDKRGHFLPEGIEYHQTHIPPLWQPVADRRRRIEGIRIILRQRVACRPASTLKCNSCNCESAYEAKTVAVTQIVPVGCTVNYYKIPGSTRSIPWCPRGIEPSVEPARSQILLGIIGGCVAILTHPLTVRPQFAQKGSPLPLAS